VDLITGAIKQLNHDVKPIPELTVGSISIAGHSAGGSALGEAAAQLGDQIHDVTMQDGGYNNGAFLDSHHKLVEWLVTGEVDKMLRVIVHGNVDRQVEGSVLKSHLNPEAITRAAHGAGHKEVTVSMDAANHDGRSVDGMYLHHRLHINGLKAKRTVSVFNMPAVAGESNWDAHMNTRDKTTKHLITEGRDGEFQGAGTGATGPMPANAPLKAPAPVPAAPKLETHAAPKPEAHAPAVSNKHPPAPAPAPQVEKPVSEPAKQKQEAIKQLAQPAHPAALADSKAFHDGGKDKELGKGDEAIEMIDVNGKLSAHIVPVFPKSPEGMVMAAMYELHRGDKRSMAEVMADHTAGHWERGKDAAVEQTTKGDWIKGRGLNDDGDATKHGQVVGHVDTATKVKGQLVHSESPIGPIQAYKTSAGMGTFSQGADPMWCGAFVTYCLARCGIEPGTLKYVPTIGSTIAKAGGQLFGFGATELDDGGGDIHKAKYSYGGSYSEAKAGETQKKLKKQDLKSAEGIDIRPGDIFYTHKHTGIIAGVNKTPTQIVIRTIEGNAGDKVISNVRTIEVDKKGVVTSAPFYGWGRAAEFGEFSAPVNDDWIQSGKGKKKNDEGKTT
jgi:hypothetical protein